MSLTKISNSMISGSAKSALDYGADLTGSVSSSDAIDAMFATGETSFVFPSGIYNLTRSMVIPANVKITFDNATIKGHFADYLIKFEFPGNTVLQGKLILTDDDPTVVSSATTLTKGVQFGDTGRAIHDVDTSACDIYASQLLVAYYFGEYSYSNVFGVLRSFNCGNESTNAVLFHAVDNGLTAPNDIYIKKLQITGVKTATWNGCGLLVEGGFGVGFGQMHIESIYNPIGAQFFSCCVDIKSGYFECVGANANSNTITTASNATVNFNGCLINCPFILNTRTNFIGCRFFKSELYARANYHGCKWPNANQLMLDVTSLEAGDLPMFNGGSSVVNFERVSGNWSEYGIGYTLPNDFDVDWNSANKTKAISSTAWNAKSLLLTANGGYFGAMGFRFNNVLRGSKAYAWAIVQIPSSNGVSEVRVGVGGIVDSGSFDVNSRTIVSKTGNEDKWILVVQPEVTIYANATFSLAMMVFEGPGGASAGDRVFIDSFGVEIGGCTYKNIGTVNSPESKSYLRWTSAPTSGTWSVGDRMIQRTPTVGQPKAWVCTVAGTPGTWVSEGNL